MSSMCNEKAAVNNADKAQPGILNFSRITSYNVCYTKLLRILNRHSDIQLWMMS